MKTKIKNWKVTVLMICAYISFIAMILAAAFGHDLIRLIFKF